MLSKNESNYFISLFCMVFLSFNVCNPTFKSDLKNPVQLMTYDPNPKLKLKKIQVIYTFQSKSLDAQKTFTSLIPALSKI
uniref:Lipoprotein n=1 Tax=Panagrolaimus sp. PS1159 TaxID=55785 RepID=A0AC35G4C3_9BILA